MIAEICRVDEDGRAQPAGDTYYVKYLSICMYIHIDCMYILMESS